MTNDSLSLKGKTALVTGASGGIGRDFAARLAQDGADLVVIARSEGKLQALARELEAQYGISVTVMAKDLADPDSPNAIYETLTAEGVQIDILINNAGFADYGPFHESNLQKQLNMMQLNMNTLTHLTYLFLQGMVARGYGKILNVASTAAFQPGPLMSVYYASKAYVLHFSEAIANELKETGVSVTALCPGPTKSGFQARANMEDSKLVQNGLMDSKSVVEIGYQGLLKGDTVVVPGFTNKVGTLLPRFVPRDMATQIVRNVQERQGH